MDGEIGCRRVVDIGGKTHDEREHRFRSLVSCIAVIAMVEARHQYNKNLILITSHVTWDRSQQIIVINWFSRERNDKIITTIPRAHAPICGLCHGHNPSSITSYNTKPLILAFAELWSYLLCPDFFVYFMQTPRPCCQTWEIFDYIFKDRNLQRNVGCFTKLLNVKC